MKHQKGDIVTIHSEETLRKLAAAEDEYGLFFDRTYVEQLHVSQAMLDIVAGKTFTIDRADESDNTYCIVIDGFDYWITDEMINEGDHDEN